MNTIFADLHHTCVELFGSTKVAKKELADPEGIELTIDSGPLLGDINTIELAIYRGKEPRSFMHIGEFTFEYDTDEERAVQEMKEYLLAAKNKKLIVDGKHFFGFKLNKKLKIIA